MDGSRLVSTVPPRPTPKSPPNLRPLIYLIILIPIILMSWTYRSRLSTINSQLSTLISPTSPTPIPEWAVYSNRNFSFTYPGSWGPPQKTPTGCGPLESIVDPDKEYEITVAARCNYDANTGKPHPSLEDYLQESPLKISYSTIDSVKVAKATSYLASSKSATEIIFMTPSNAIYSVSLNGFTISDYPSPIPASILPVFAKILSTLKFVH